MPGILEETRQQGVREATPGDMSELWRVLRGAHQGHLRHERQMTAKAAHLLLFAGISDGSVRNGHHVVV